MRNYPANAQPAIPQLVSTTPECSWGCASFNSDWLNVSCSAEAGQGFASISLTENTLMPRWVPTASGTPSALRGGRLTLGAFFSIFGAEDRDLGPRDRQRSDGFPLPLELGDVSVEFRRNGVLIDTAFLVFA